MSEQKVLGPDSRNLCTYRELPIGATAIGRPEGRKTGLWRYMRPRIGEKIPPCQESCPAGNWVQRFVREAAEGNLDKAWRVIILENPFPGVCGRVCYHPCEDSCNRHQYDGSVSIHSVERAIAEAFTDKPLMSPAKEKSGGNVAIVGSGPAGLACAYFLRTMGHRVSIFEARRELGGIPNVGIPPYRLPRYVLNKEISRILALGVDVKTECRVGEDLPFSELLSFDAVFLAHGAQKTQPPDIPGIENEGVCQGLEFLARSNVRKEACPGKEVVVVGGGNVAIDVARTLVRLGLSPLVIYRRTRDEMPAYAEEVNAAQAEGVRFEFLLSPALIQNFERGRLLLICNKMEIEGVDQLGRSRIVPRNGEKATFEANQIIMATGEMPDLSYLPDGFECEKGLLSVTEWGQTSYDKVFAGGDTIDQARNIAEAIGSAKRAAIAMDHFMKGDNLQDLQNKGLLAKTIREHMGLSKSTLGEPQARVHFEDLNLAYSHELPPHKPIELSIHRRMNNFEEINKGLDLETAVVEAERCLSCGNCKLCGNCYMFCPDGAVQLDSSTGHYAINYDYCKGCGICHNECPASAIIIETEGEV